MANGEDAFLLHIFFSFEVFNEQTLMCLRGGLVIGLGQKRCWAAMLWREKDSVPNLSLKVQVSL